MANPTLLVKPIAENGTKNVIPNTTTTPGLMSQDAGFPPETSQPLESGGIPPRREDMNGALYLISRLAFYTQKGWVFEWDSSQSYFKGCEVYDTADGKKYRCISDVAAGASRPSVNTSKWEEINFTVDLSPYAKKHSPAFTGVPTAPTASPGTNTTQIATTAFVQASLPDLSPYAKINSPTFTGVPKAPTASVGTNTTQIATCAFVRNSLPDLSPYAKINSPTFTGTPKAPTASAGTNNTQIATTAFVMNAIPDITPLAPKNSPTFTGVPKAPTAATGTATTQIATTEFVKNAINDVGVIIAANYANPGYVKFSSGFIIQWGVIDEIVPDLVNFPGGANQGYHEYSFPLAFPTACFSIIGGTYSETLRSQLYNASAGVQSWTKTSFVAFTDGHAGEGFRRVGMSWVAFGI